MDDAPIDMKTEEALKTDAKHLTIVIHNTVGTNSLGRRILQIDDWILLAERRS
jgi:hypothetical protein